MITKKELLKSAGKSKSYLPLLNDFLFNLVLKNIVSYNDLTIREKESLNRILEGKNKTFGFNTKSKTIKDRRNEIVRNERKWIDRRIRHYNN